jgi:hypothetical protein
MAAAGLAVLGLGVYLFIEVRSAPASPQVASAKSTPAQPAAVPDEPAAPPAADAVPAKPVKPAKPAGTRPVEPETAPPRTPEEMQKADPNNDSLMDEANRAYDKQEFEEARAIAGRILAKDPTNVRMLRIMVSAACVEVDKDEAAKWLGKLPPGDQAAMKTRCTRYGVTFPDAK